MSEPKPHGKPFGIDKGVVMEAYRKVVANKGAPGVGEVSIAEFEQDLRDNLYKIRQEPSAVILHAGIYVGAPARAVPTAISVLVRPHALARDERLFYPPSSLRRHAAGEYSNTQVAGDDLSCETYRMTEGDAMPYIPGVTELLIGKLALAIKGALAAKGAAATAGSHFIAQQAGQQALQALVSGLSIHSLGASVLPALKAAVLTGSGVLVLGGTTYTVAEVAAYVIAKLRGEGYSNAEIKRYFRDNYDLDVAL